MGFNEVDLGPDSPYTLMSFIKVHTEHLCLFIVTKSPFLYVKFTVFVKRHTSCNIILQSTEVENC
jgi:hypothetical protein